MRTSRKKIAKASAWTCYACEKFAFDPIMVQNHKTGDLIALHRGCLTTLVQVLRAPTKAKITAAIKRQGGK